MRSPMVGAGFTNNNCRGGFYQQYLTTTNNINKPAPTPQITYINLDFLPLSKHKRSIYPVWISCHYQNISGGFTLFVGAGLPDCGLLRMIVGETGPHK